MTISRIALVGIVVVVIGPNPAEAQEVMWHRDYTEAVREAKAKGKPILLCFGTAECTWCKKLDATTFKDRKVVDTLNEQFVPVKIDANRFEALAESLGVQSFPTLILAAADGRILGRQLGYLNPEKMASFLTKARREAASEPPRPSTSPALAANNIIIQARADFDECRFLECLLRCDEMTTANPSHSVATEARQLTDRIVANPAAWGKVCKEINDHLDALYPDVKAQLQR